jgi:predicted 2-oxoglutarate/Fe(II)-dependent dioxygenase YbiX
MNNLTNRSFNVGDLFITMIDLFPVFYSKKFCIQFNNILSQDECNNLIQLSELSEYEQAKINTDEMDDGVRNNDRCMMNSVETVAVIWERVMGSLKAEPEVRRTLLTMDETVWTATGLNEHMRFLRYDAGTFFASHEDDTFVRGHERSFMMMMLYLNEGFDGGSTRFLSEEEPHKIYDVVPRTGSILLFQHDCLHEGAMVESGRKYAIQTDVMYACCAQTRKERLMGADCSGLI